MPSQIIQNYLNDTTVDVQLRRNALDDLKSGIPEQKIEKALVSKYGATYAPKDVEVMQPSSSAIATQLRASREGGQPITEGQAFNLAQREATLAKEQRDPKSIAGRLESAGEAAKSMASEGFGQARRGAEEVIAGITGEDSFVAGTGERVESGEGFVERAQTVGEGLLDMVSGTLETVFSPVGGVVGAAQPEVEAGITKFMETRTPEQKQAIGQFKQFIDEMPEDVKKSIEATFNIAGLGAAKPAAKKTGQIIAETTPKVIEKGGEVIQVSKQLLKDFEASQAQKQLIKLDNFIDESIEKGVRPSLTGEKKTPGGLQKFQDKARESVFIIKENKPNLSFTDEFGEVTEGILPRSLKEFNDAVQQTKRNIYEQYSSLAKQAGEAGVDIPLTGIADELTPVINSKVLKTQAPEIVDYAAKQRDRFIEAASYTAEEAEEAIKLMNQSLEAFYRNPSYDTASKAYIDSLIVNNIRKALDNKITNVTGKQYQALKNQYSALKAVEKDVAHRALVDARKNSKGLLDFTDVFSGGEAVAGLVSLNPALLAKAGTQKAIKEYFKFINDPNTIIRRMFQKVDDTPPLSKAGQTAKTTEALTSPKKTGIIEGTKPELNIKLSKPQTLRSGAKNQFSTSNNEMDLFGHIFENQPPSIDTFYFKEGVEGGKGIATKNFKNVLNDFKKLGNDEFTVSDVSDEMIDFLKRKESQGIIESSGKYTYNGTRDPQLLYKISSKSKIPAKTTGLLEEAKKYKSAEEFISNKFGVDSKLYNKTLGSRSINTGKDTIKYTIKESGDGIRLFKLLADKKGTGAGSDFMSALKAYSDSTGKPITIMNPTNKSFWSKFDYLEKSGGRDLKYTPK